MARNPKLLKNYQPLEVDLERDGVILRHDIVKDDKSGPSDSIPYSADRKRLGMIASIPLVLSGPIWYYSQMCLKFVNHRDLMAKMIINYAAAGSILFLVLGALAFFQTFGSKRLALSANGIMFRDSDNMVNVSWREVNISTLKPVLGIKQAEYTTIKGSYLINSLVFADFDAILKISMERKGMVDKIDSEIVTRSS